MTMRHNSTAKFRPVGHLSFYRKMASLGAWMGADISRPIDKKSLQNLQMCPNNFNQTDSCLLFVGLNHFFVFLDRSIQQVLTASHDGTARLWNLQGERLGVVRWWVFLGCCYTRNTVIRCYITVISTALGMTYDVYIYLLSLMYVFSSQVAESHTRFWEFLPDKLRELDHRRGKPPICKPL